MTRKKDFWHGILYWVDRKLLLILAFMLCILSITQSLLTVDGIRHILNYQAKLQNEKFNTAPSLPTTASVTIRTDTATGNAFLLINGRKYCPLNSQTRIDVSDGDVLHIDGRTSDRNFTAYIAASPCINDRYLKSQAHIQGKLMPIGKIKYK